MPIYEILFTDFFIYDKIYLMVINIITVGKLKRKADVL